jgi:hypothetical protein
MYEVAQKCGALIRVALFLGAAPIQRSEKLRIQQRFRLGMVIAT